MNPSLRIPNHLADLGLQTPMSICSSVRVSVTKTPQQLKINHSSYHYLYHHSHQTHYHTTSNTKSLHSISTQHHSHTITINITHNIKQKITKQHHTTSLTQHHPHKLALEQLLSFSACFCNILYSTQRKSLNSTCGNCETDICFDFEHK